MPSCEEITITNPITNTDCEQCINDTDGVGRRSFVADGEDCLITPNSTCEDIDNTCEPKLCADITIKQQCQTCTDNTNGSVATIVDLAPGSFCLQTAANRCDANQECSGKKGGIFVFSSPQKQKLAHA